ncbi:hypothetical protein F5B22DRAFT_627928 [Xylaria bambusicola]|uniref:uncharacterized protein n=1 Tax=Xylaria bambusicola TaxID=326684 RepID=UPI0020076304|nr:uncharacterized protein F5B22DRAFT_627928 [Xylaria bambusicola]KAI0505366.1 hypothetical protein F5B22DRAFT_627928 [Xylaria bambusicola]
MPADEGMKTGHRPPGPQWQLMQSIKVTEMQVADGITKACFTLQYNMSSQMATLPSLTDEPTLYPGCCFSLSRPLLATIRALLESIPILTPPDVKPSNSSSEHASVLLSIGSGTGLLEELLQRYLESSEARDSSHHSSSSTWRVEGVEVNPAVNVYLPEDRINHVVGTWAVLGSRARDATALMFVYPRDGSLVRRYIDRTSMTMGPTSRTTCGGVQAVLWLGPKCDWEDTGLGSFTTRDEYEIFEMRSSTGLAGYEMLAVLRRKTIASLA